MSSDVEPWRTVPEKVLNAKKEQLESLSEWVKSLRLLILIRINRLRRSMNKKGKSVFSNPDVAKTFSKHFVVPADNAPINIVSVCKPIIYNI